MIDVLRTFAERVDPTHTAILVVDMQNDFCAEGGYIHRTRKADMSAQPALAKRIDALVEHGRGAGATIAWITANYEPRFLSGPATLKRDERDRNRSAAPLRRADDAHELDNSELDIEGGVRAAIAIVDAARARR